LKTNYVLIDYENVPVRSLALLKDERFRIKVFLGPRNTKLPIELVVAMQEFGDRAEYIVLQSPGTNALDFHITYYLGVLAANDPEGFFHIISKDTGFDPLLQHLKTKKVMSFCSASIEEMPCFRQSAANLTGANGVPQETKRTRPDSSPEIGEMIKIAVEDLAKRNGSKPCTPKTLRSTIHAKLGKETPAAHVDTVYNALVERGYVKVDGTKVVYALPAP
jgi:hypothetical protein